MPPLFVAAIVVLLEGLAFGVILPVLPEFVHNLGGDSKWAGLAFALATAPRVIFAPLWGKFSEHRGRRWPLATVCLGTMTASVGWALCVPLGKIAFGAIAWLMISRGFYGIFAAQSVLGLAVASDVTTPEKRAGAMGVIGAAFGIAFTIGPWLGGEFADAFVTVRPTAEQLANNAALAAQFAAEQLRGEQAIGWLMGAFQLTSVLVIVSLLKETHPEHVAERDDREAEEAAIYIKPSRLLHLASAPAVACMMVVCFLATVAYSVMFPTFQTLADAWYHWDKGHVGMALSIFGLIGAFVQGGMIRPTVKRLGETRTAVIGLVLLAIGLGWIAILPPPASPELVAPHVKQFWAALCFMAVGTGYLVPAVMAMMSLTVGSHDQGPIHGLNQSATSLGRAAGYLVAGALFAISPMWAYGVAAGIAVLAALLIVPARRIPRPVDQGNAADNNTDDTDTPTDATTA
ncbi:MAG: MFS transporter [Phycisphaera sp.]|nr:MFS transporter [Phycisphaera sp.]